MKAGSPNRAGNHAAGRNARRRAARAGAPPGIEPHELAQLAGELGNGASVTCIDYGPSEVLIRKVDDMSAFLATHRPESSVVRWIMVEGLAGAEVLRSLAEKYELHPLAIEDVLHPGQRPKVESFAASAEHVGRLFVVARLVHRCGQDFRSDQISFFLGRRTLISFQEQGHAALEPILHRLSIPDSRIRRNDASFLLYSLLDAIVDQFFPLIEEVSTELESLEDLVLDDGSPSLLRQIHRTKRDLTSMRRVAWPMRELISQLHRDEPSILSDTTQTYLRDLYDNLVQILDLLETQRDFVTSLTETHLSVSSQRLNDIMKTLTIISTIFVPLTFLAGVYGMNMPIPENEWALSYPLFWLFSVVMAACMLYLFRRRGWL
ncbi:MAG: magnesium/cobalt transporter CorA [Methylotetracoccus sp.]